MTQKLITEYQNGFNVSNLKTEHLYKGSDTQNLRISGNVQMKGTAKYGKKRLRSSSRYNRNRAST